MFALRIPALALSAALQVLPIARVALPATQTAANFLAIIFRWGAGAAAILGGVQAVSGASTVITTPLNQTVTNGVPLGSSQIRLITAPDQAHYWQVTGLPPGLSLSGTSGSTDWRILGTPTATGTYNVGLTAKDKIDSKADRTVTATMVMSVLPGSGGGGNAPPTANPQSVTTTEDAAKAIVLSGSDPDGNPLTYAIVTPPTQGTLSGTPPNVTYTPATNYHGPDSFTFRVNDGTTNSSPATVSITITAVNDAPVANPQSLTTAEDTAKAITLSGTDVEGSPLTYSIVTQPAHGTLSGTPPNVTFTPATNYHGPDSFTFRVSDGSLNSAPATVSLTTTPVNDPPTATPQSVSTPENTPRAITLTGADVEGSPLVYSIVAGPVHGSLSGTPPNVTYTPGANYSGPDSFTFKVSDGSLDSAVVAVSISVSSVNTAPLATEQSLSTPAHTALNISLTGTDPDGDQLTYAIVTQPAHGSLGGTPPNVTYTSDADYAGPDSFTFKVNDGNTDSPPAMVSITVTPANRPPVAANTTNATMSGASVTLSPLSDSTDPDGDALTIVLVSPTNGTAAIQAGTRILFTPAPAFVGLAHVGYTISDGRGGSATGLISIVVVAPASTNQFSIAAASPVLDAQTGLFAQRVNVTNTGSTTVAAVRLTVRGLRSGVTLQNASGTNAGQPSVRYDAPLNPGQGVTFVLEYYAPDRMPFTSALEADAVLPLPNPTGAGGAVPVDRSFLDRSDPAHPRFTIEFASVPGRTYTIIYTDDLVNWHAATPSFTASASITQWHDDGPPKTASKPGNGSRFYRVLAAP